MIAFPAEFPCFLGGVAMSESIKKPLLSSVVLQMNESKKKRWSTRRSAMTGALSAAEFRLGASQYPNMDPKSLDIARAILVDGEQMADVVKRTGVDRRNVHFWVKQIYTASVPTGWVSEVVTLPRVKMDEVLKMQDRERSKWMETHAAQ